MSLSMNTRWECPSTVAGPRHWLAVDLRDDSRAQPRTVVVLDTSASMVGGRLEQLRAAAAWLIDAFDGPVEVWAFSSTTWRIDPASQSALAALEAAGKSRLDVALNAALTRASAGPLHVIVVSDGGPTDVDGRRQTPEALCTAVARRENLRISALIIGGSKTVALDALTAAHGGVRVLWADGAPPAGLVDNLPAASQHVTLHIEGAAHLAEAWHVGASAPQALRIDNDGARLQLSDSTRVLLGLEWRPPLGTRPGSKTIGTLLVRGPDSELVQSLTLQVVRPGSSKLANVDAELAALRTRLATL